MTELAIHNPNTVAALPNPITNPEGRGAMRLVEWAEEAMAANHLAKALCHTPFAGSWKGDVDGATAAILKGAEVGLTPVTALGAFDNIHGTPAPKAITLRALVQSHGHDLEIIEETDEKAVARYRRNGRGDWLTTEFTVEHAKAMKLLAKDSWIKQRGAMLVARVTSKAARLVASDVILGIGYSAEEIRDSDDWQGPPARVTHEPAAAPDRMRAMLGTTAEQVPDEPAETGEAMTQPTRGRMFALFAEHNITDRDEQIRGIVHIIGREIESRSEITEAEGLAVIAKLEARTKPVTAEDAFEPSAS